jgi:hypothetical protein
MPAATWWRRGVVATSLAIAAAAPAGPPPDPILDTTPADIFLDGTQPMSGGLNNGQPVPLSPILSVQSCATCHGNYGPTDPFLVQEPVRPWAASMMGQSARDPLVHAAMAIASQDAAGGEQLCVRCHVPAAYLEGRTPTGPAEYTDIDREGINCNFCHRLVNPEFEDGVSPDEDLPILADLDEAGWLPAQANTARYLLDPAETRRGPYPLCETPGECGPEDVPINPHGVPTFDSPFHSSAELCWTCHGVSNPLFTKQPDGTYLLGALDEPHPTLDELDMFPLHRTFQEWLNSYYSSAGVNHQGRFGGTNSAPMKDCQDCHMPDTQGWGCNLQFEPFFERMDVPQHSFMGSNTWVLKAVRDLYPDTETGLSAASVDEMIARNTDFLQKASDLSVLRIGDQIRARIVNQTGHKLPTGFPDGRRIWVNVKFFNCVDVIIQEYGHYDFNTATLTGDDTTVYEMRLGMDAAMASTTGLPEGETFHFLLANEILKDNRIPPAGWFNSTAAANQTAPVGVTYGNGQHWADSYYNIPSDAARAVVTVYYQVTSKEFIEFLRDANHDQSPASLGQVAYNLWEQHGMSTPVAMDMAELDLGYEFPAEDVNMDGVVDFSDVLDLLANWGTCTPPPPDPCPGDIDGNGSVDITDVLGLLSVWGASC